MKQIDMTTLLLTLRDSGLGLREAIAWTSGWVAKDAEINPGAAYKVEDVSELLDYFYQLILGKEIKDDVCSRSKNF